MVDFQAIGQIANARSPSIRMGDDNDLVPAVDELLRWMSAAATS